MPSTAQHRIMANPYKMHATKRITLRPMKTDAIRARLRAMTTRDLQLLSVKSRIGLRTLWELRSGETVHASEKTSTALTPYLRRVKPKAQE